MESIKFLNLYQNGVYVENTTPVHRLLSLVYALRPVITRFPLVRIGSANDGGYLVPDDFRDISACFSPGVEHNSSFEIDLMHKTGIGSHLADYSVDSPPSNFQPKSFLKKFLGPNSTTTHITLEDWVKCQKEYHLTQDFLLQMDIEGGEYLTLLAAPQELIRRFRIIVIEIHYVECWAHPLFFSTVEAMFEKLLVDFHVVHIHPNNHGALLDLNGFKAPQFFEITLLRKDRSAALSFCQDFPHPLDKACYPARDELVLPDQWVGTNALG
jgi:hypothetical protein